MKICTVCKIEKPLSEFYRQKNTKGGAPYYLMARCKSCFLKSGKCRIQDFDPVDRANYLDGEWERKLLPKFGISIDQYIKIFQEQDEVCAICHNSETAVSHNTPQVGEVRIKRLSVDHDHVTGKVRGLLCMACNTRLGYFEKNDLLASMLDYISTLEEN